MTHPAVAPPRAIVDPVAPYPHPALNAALARMDERTAQWASASTDSPAYCLRRALARIEMARDASGRIVGPDIVLNAVLPWLTRALSALEVRPLPSRREIEDAIPQVARYTLTDKGRGLVGKVTRTRRRETVQTPTGPRTFTSFVRRCSGCDRDFYVSEEALTEAREAELIPPTVSDAALATDWEGCLTCGTGKLHEAEYVTDEVGQSIPNAPRP